MQESTCNAGDSRRSPGEGNGNPLQYSCLENPMNKGAWQSIVYGVARVGHNLATKPANHHQENSLTEFECSRVPIKIMS